MQTEKVDKNLINTEVTLLTDLKERYKGLTGKEWVLEEGINVNEYYSEYTQNLLNKIIDQGNKVRKLKAEKANKDVIDLEVKSLLDLKADYKEVTGVEYKPQDSKTAVVENKEMNSSSGSSSSLVQELHNKVVEQGNKVRKLKAEKSSAEVLLLINVVKLV